MKRPWAKLFALLLVPAMFAVACGDDDTTTEDPIPPADDADMDESDEDVDDPVEEVDDGLLARVVSLSPTATEILFAIGAGDQVVAVDQFSNYPENLPPADLDGFAPDAEAIAAYEPQVVVMQSNDASSAIEALGITVVVQDSPADFEGIYTQILELGDATGNDEGAEELIAEMRVEIDALIADAPDASGRTYYHELGTDFYSLNSDSFVAQIYALFGLVSIGDNAGGDAFAGYLPLTEEFILTEDPDFIFLADTIWASQTSDTVAARPGWSELSAVQSGAVVELDDDVASRWGPRVVAFAEAIADVLKVVAVPA
jgi:iron complex transport system substrate-binding protein